MTLAVDHDPAAPSIGARLVSDGGERALPLRATYLRVRARGGYAQVVLEQRFTNPWPEPLVVTYALPLPHDGAVSGFAFRIGERRVVGEVDTLEDARARFEQAMLEGRSAGLLEQERGSLFTQRLGNIPPGEDILAEIVIDQPLRWREGGEWEWRFPLVAAPRYLGRGDRVPDGDRLIQDVTLAGDGPQLGFDVLIEDALAGPGVPTSPSHALRARQVGDAWEAQLDAVRAASLDRDIVVRWPVARNSHRMTLDVARAAQTDRMDGASAYAVLTITPPVTPGTSERVARDLVLLIDTSGSMAGAPLEQARAVAMSIVDSLVDQDHLEMVEFSHRPRCWRAEPEPATPAMIGQARDWLMKLEAGGATEMVSGLWEALRPRRAGAQRQVILITDGLVGFESEVVQTLRDALPPGSRLHSVGVGPASNRSLTAPCARAGRGIEVQAGSSGDLQSAITTLKARLDAPLVTDLAIAGDGVIAVAPRALPDLYAGAPLRVMLELRPAGGRVQVSGQTSRGTWRDEITIDPMAAGTGPGLIARCYAREVVEDLEIDLAAGAGRADVDARIRTIGCDFQIATRLTAWIAVAEEADVDPRKPFRRIRQPQQLPHGLSAEGLGLTPFASPLASTFRKRAVPAQMQTSDSYLMSLNECFDLDFGEYDRVPPPAPHRPQYRLVARGAGRTASAWIFLLEVRGEDFAWHLPQRIQVTWANGDTSVAELLDDQTTAPGSVAVGATIRLVLRLPADSPQSVPKKLILKSVQYGTQRVPVEA